MQYQQLALISHEIEKTQIHQRAADGYVNATAMCKAAGKQFGHYNSAQGTRDFLAALSVDIGIPISSLVIAIKGGNADMQGTYVHPDVAVHLGQWCSPKFAVAVSRWVREWMTGQAKGANLPYHLKRYLVNNANVPMGHFSMLAEMAICLIGPLEHEGYTVPDNMVPDISEGQIFCKWLRETKGINTNGIKTYIHIYEDGRKCLAKAYPIELLGDLRKHFYEVWLPLRSRAYFQDKDPAALPYLEKILLALPAQPVGVKSAFTAIKNIIKPGGLPMPESLSNSPAAPNSAQQHFARMREALAKRTEQGK